VRVGLTLRVEDLPERGERRDALDQRWVRLLESEGLVPVPVPNVLADAPAFVAAAGVGMLVLTGGNDLCDLPGATGTAPERDRTEHALLDHARARGMPVLGVCRGLQLLAARAGGRVERVEGHVARPHLVRQVGRPPWPIADRPEVNSFHDWGIPADALGDLVPYALAPDGTVEAAGHPTLPHVGVMWHPERPPEDPADRALLRALAAAG
jgi:putative glutamine amidotransferase